MDAFLSAHADKITGVLSLFDRILIKGHLPLGYPQGMEKLLLRHGKLFKDLKGFVLQQSIKDHARRMAEESGRPYEYHVGPIAKEKRAKEIAQSRRPACAGRPLCPGSHTPDLGLGATQAEICAPCGHLPEKDSMPQTAQGWRILRDHDSALPHAAYPFGSPAHPTGSRRAAKRRGMARTALRRRLEIPAGVLRTHRSRRTRLRRDPAHRRGRRPIGRSKSSVPDHPAPTIPETVDAPPAPAAKASPEP